MPIVAINLTKNEAERVDIIAHKERRARKGQVHVIFSAGLVAAEGKSIKLKKSGSYLVQQTALHDGTLIDEWEVSFIDEEGWIECLARCNSRETANLIAEALNK